VGVGSKLTLTPPPQPSPTTGGGRGNSQGVQRVSESPPFNGCTPASLFPDTTVGAALSGPYRVSCLLLKDDSPARPNGCPNEVLS